MYSTPIHFVSSTAGARPTIFAAGENVSADAGAMLTVKKDKRAFTVQKISPVGHQPEKSVLKKKA